MASKSLLQKMQERLKQLESQQNRKVAIREGMNRLRVLPSWRGEDEEFYLEVLAHYDVTPDVRYLVCPRTVGAECPVDDLVAKWSAGDSTQQARAERVAAKSQYVMNVIVLPATAAERNGDSPPMEVKLYTATRGVLYELLGYFTDPEYGDFTDPKEGFDVLINRKGMDMNTRYTVRLARNPSRIRLKNWKESLIDIDREFRPKEANEIMRLLGGTEKGNRRGRPEMAEMGRARHARDEGEDVDDDDIPY